MPFVQGVDGDFRRHTPIPDLPVKFAHLYWASGSRFRSLNLSDGQALPLWPDEVERADPAQSSVASRPLVTLANSNLNYRPAVSFDGSNDGLGPIAFSSIGLPHSVVIILDNRNTAAANFYWMDGFDASHRRIIGKSSANWFHHAGADAFSAGGATTGKIAARSLIVSGTSDVLTLNGATVATATAGDQTMTGITLGQSTIAANNANIDIAFVGVYAGDVTADAGWAALIVWASLVYGVSLS